MMGERMPRYARCNWSPIAPAVGDCFLRSMFAAPPCSAPVGMSASPGSGGPTPW